LGGAVHDAGAAAVSCARGMGCSSGAAVHAAGRQHACGGGCREGKGHLTRQQVMRAVDPLMAVARVGAMLQCTEAGRAYQVRWGQAPLPLTCSCCSKNDVQQDKCAAAT
jgi:hypothetical protein